MRKSKLDKLERLFESEDNQGEIFEESQEAMQNLKKKLPCVKNID